MGMGCIICILNLLCYTDTHFTQGEVRVEPLVVGCAR